MTKVGGHVSSSLTSNHFSDGEGNDQGGTAYGQGFLIAWQRGPLGSGEDRTAPNGAMVEDVIAATIDRLEHYQASKFASDHNTEALDHLRAAVQALEARTA